MIPAQSATPGVNLTYAEQRALEIGITIAGGASVILLDEPTAGMSKSETTRFIHLIREVTEGKTLLTVGTTWAWCSAWPTRSPWWCMAR